MCFFSHPTAVEASSRGLLRDQCPARRPVHLSHPARGALRDHSSSGFPPGPGR